MLRYFYALTPTLALTLSLPAADPGVPERDALLRQAAEFRPGAGNFRWQTIPWVVDPSEALRQARAETRPLFVWLAGGRDRDGTPLERCCGYAASLRCGPLNDPQVVRLVSANFVPVALNHDRLPHTPEGEFFHKLLEQWAQGIWIVSPDGKVLAHHYHKPTPGLSYSQNQQKWVNGTVRTLEDAVKAADPLPPRSVTAANPLPDRGVGENDDGGVRLAVSVLGLIRGQQEGPPAVDSIRFTKAEWEAFTPPAGETTWTLPTAVGQRFAPTLSPLTDSIFVPRPADVQTATVTGTMLRSTDNLTVIRYAGRWDALHHRDGDPKLPVRGTATGEGVGVYDPGAKRMKSLVWLLRGSYKNGTAAPLGTASIVEWQAEGKPESVARSR